MQNLKYLDKYEQSKFNIRIYLKDLPSNRIKPKEIIQSLYQFLFCKTIELSEINQISDLIYNITL